MARMAAGADPGDPCRHHGLSELRVLRQKAIARVDRLRSGRLGRREHLGLIQIALARRRWPDEHRLIGLADMQSLRVCLGIDGDGAQAHALGGAEDATGDLAAIGDQDGCEHEAGLEARATGVEAPCPL
jgi:hypothetical protein